MRSVLCEPPGPLLAPATAVLCPRDRRGEGTQTYNPLSPGGPDVADIDDRWFRKDPTGRQKVPTTRHGKGKRWDVRWRDDTGRQRHKAFERKQEAETFLAQIQADLARGTYTDPAARKVTVRTCAESWLAAQTFDPSTREATELRLRLHILPELGHKELRALRPSAVQAWTRGLQQRLASNYVRVVFANLSAVLSAAVDDGLIGRNPCRAGSVRPPAPERRRIVPWSVDQVTAVTVALLIATKSWWCWRPAAVYDRGRHLGSVWTMLTSCAA